MIYHLVSEKYYLISAPPEAEAPRLAENLLLSYPFEENLQIENWVFVPFNAEAHSFCIECNVRDQFGELIPLLLTVEFTDTGAKATWFEPVT